MKPKGLLFALFILYWVVVYGVALFSSNARNKFRQTAFSHFMPYGYSMFTPMTKTEFDVSYHFFKQGAPVKFLSLQSYIESEYNKGLLHNKSAFLKSKVYLDQLYQLDLAFQKNEYVRSEGLEFKDFQNLVDKDSVLSPIVQNLRNFSKLYRMENPSFEADSVEISVSRKPVILPFNKQYKGDFTYLIGDMVFYKTHYVFNSINKER